MCIEAEDVSWQRHQREPARIEGPRGWTENGHARCERDRTHDDLHTLHRSPKPQPGQAQGLDVFGCLEREILG